MCFILLGFASAGVLAQETNPPVEAQIEQAKTLIQTGKYQEAITRLDEVLNNDRRNAIAWYWKGRAYHALDDTATAAKCYRRALRERPNLTEADAYLTKIKNQPQLEAWYQAAENSWRRADWQGVENNYRQILNLDPTYKDASSKLRVAQNKMKAQEFLGSATKLRQQQKFDDAIKLLEEAIGIDPERKSDFQVLIKQIEQEKARAQAAIKPEKPVERTKNLPPSTKIDTARTPAQNDSSKASSADSLTDQHQKSASKRAWSPFSVQWIAAVGAALFVVAIIVIAFVQKYRTKSKQDEPTITLPSTREHSQAEPIRDLIKMIRDRQVAAPEIQHSASLPKLERYRIEHELGRGGMSRVYKAYDLKLERFVALKVIRLETQMEKEEIEERIARFRREARAIAKLNHPNIVSLYDYDERDGMFYMTMEFVRGLTVEQILRGNKQLAIPAVTAIVQQVCKALEYAHKNGTIHRDIKPSNIMLNDEAMVKVVDFGVAKMLAETWTQFHTQAGMRLGSPTYMSPEQIEAKKLDGRTDIYSLGVVFYEMLTGVKPFTMNERENLSPLFYAILHTEPPKLTLNRPEVPATIEAIVEKMLAKKPERRYQNAGEIIEALNSL